MQQDFWHQRWQENRIGFHQPQPNDYLIQYLPTLTLQPHARILVPLSGKTLDIGWLLMQGFRVVAIELSRVAIHALMQQLKDDLGIVFEQKQLEACVHYHHPEIDLFVGDFFDVSNVEIGQIDAIYDRAALIALPPEMRARYAQHLIDITQGAVQLLVSYQYDQDSFQGPPFSVEAEEIEQLYASQYSIRQLAHVELSEQHKGRQAQEKIWYLRAK